MRISVAGVTIILLLVTPLSADRDDRSFQEVPHFSVVAVGYPAASDQGVRLDVIIRIPYDAIQFLKSESGFEATYEVSVSLQDKEGVQTNEDIWQGNIFVKEFSKTISMRQYELAKRSFFVVPGKYDVIVEVTDLDTHKSGKRKTVKDLSRLSEGMVLSDLLLVQADQTDREDFPMGVPTIPAKISDSDSVYFLYYEARVSPGSYKLHAKVFSVDGELINEEVFNKSSDSPIAVDRIALEKAGMSQTKFKVEVELYQNEKTSTSEIVLQVKWLGLVVDVSDLEDAIEQLTYIARREIIRKMQNAKPKKKEELFKEFWKKKDPAPDTPENELMEEYYRRVQYANEKFSSFYDGWRTDMGMIFILFGPPDDVEINVYSREGKSYQKWYYYLINKTFTFIDRTGFGDYELLEPFYAPYGSPLRYR